MMSKNVIFYGDVEIGDGCIIQDNVIIGNSEGRKVDIGENAMIRSGTIIYSDVKIGKDFKTGHNVVIREKTEIGDDVLIGTNSVIDGNCKVGNKVRVQTNVYITAYTIIEDDVFMGPCAVTTNDKYMKYDDSIMLKGSVIKRGAKIGANATILPGIVIGEKAVVGAGAVVTKNVKNDDIVTGVPAEVLSQIKLK